MKAVPSILDVNISVVVPVACTTLLGSALITPVSPVTTIAAVNVGFDSASVRLELPE